MAARSDEYGILNLASLPDDSWQPRWDGILAPEGLKERLLNFSLFVLGRRGHVSPVGLPVHGLLVLQGEPGTGKTTLARGLAHTAARELGEADGGDTVYCEVDAYRLASGLLGESQKNVERLFFRSIPNLAKDHDRVIVLLDEVENIAVARARTSLDANPVDVHRATNAVLTGLDHLAHTFRNVLLLATTNFPDGLDEAFLSRVDIVQDMGMPPPEVLVGIIADTLREVAGAQAGDLDDEEREALAAQLKGLDGRRTRKLLFDAIVADRALSLDPSQVRASHVLGVLGDPARRGWGQRAGAVDA